MKIKYLYNDALALLPESLTEARPTGTTAIGSDEGKMRTAFFFSFFEEKTEKKIKSYGVFTPLRISRVRMLDFRVSINYSGQIIHDPMAILRFYDFALTMLKLQINLIYKIFIQIDLQFYIVCLRGDRIWPSY